ncbi:MAG: HlyD family efflux transporter periplasmic adaptor subunit [Pseudomonadota bacterium]
MPGNQIAVSLAHERLEMIRTICRLRGQSAHLSLPQGLFNAIAEVASGDWSKAQELADLIARATGEPAIMLGQLQGGCVREVHISGQAVVADRASARISAVEEMERAVRMPGANRCALVVGSAATQAVITTQERPLPEPIAQALTEVFNAHSRHGAYKPRLRKAAKVIGCIMAVMALGLVPVSDGVNLPASLVAQNHRTVTAPFDGRVAEIAVKDGQSVRAGETVLLRMDTTEIEADIALAVADLSAAITRRDAARGTRDAAALREAEIETTQATLRHDALKAQLGRADVLAPIDGIVQAEALEQRASSYVSLGTTVLEIVDPDTLEVEIMVSPRARGRLNAGAIGRFQPDAIPTTKIGFDLSTISVAPVSARKDVNFAARSKPLHGLDTSRLRPGMEGVARFEHDDLPLAVLIWRRIRDWALLTLWI